MTHFEVKVQIMRSVKVSAETPEEAKKLAEEEIKKTIGTDKYYIQTPKNLDKPKKVQAAKKV